LFPLVHAKAEAERHLYRHRSEAAKTQRLRLCVHASGQHFKQLLN